MLKTEHIVYLLRKTNLTREEIGKLHPAQALDIYEETLYQELLEDWRNQQNVGSILAAIYNTIPRKSNKQFTSKDFFDMDKPTRLNDVVTKVDEYTEIGIRLPKN